MQVILQEHHNRLVLDKERICAQAGLQPRYFQQSMTDVCSAAEIEWVKHFKKYRIEGVPGLVITKLPQADTRCQLICAALIRNYIDARVVPLNSLLEGGVDPLEPTVLVLPNLYVDVGAKQFPAWKVQQLYDLLLSRTVRSKPTVAYVENMAQIAGAYGKPFVEFLNTFKFAQ